MSEDRIWIEKEYLPNLNGKILYVGIADYTANYPSYIPTESIWHTIDLDPNADGTSATKHMIGSFLEYSFDEKYDHISLYGLWGSPLPPSGSSSSNDLKEIIKFTEKADNMLNIGGTMMLGPRWRSELLSIEDCYDIFNFCKENKYNELFEGKVGSNMIYWGRKTC